MAQAEPCGHERGGESERVAHHRGRARGLDALRTRESRREESLEPGGVGALQAHALDPEQEMQLADSVGIALLIVLETLEPAERVAFVLHDLFDLPFAEIAPIVGRSRDAARQLASRARRRVQGAGGAQLPERTRHRGIVDAFLIASREGDFGALLALLDPSAVVRADAATIQLGTDPSARGAEAVATTFVGRARVARLALIDGAPGAVWAVRGVPRVLFEFTIHDGKITAIDLNSNPARLESAVVTWLD